MERKARNINPFTDFGFKKLFGEEANKDLLLDFLNAVLEKEIETIESIEFSKNEQQGISKLDRRAVFDIYCITANGERIIVEIQKAFQQHFKDRSLYYSTFAIQEQALRGKWNFQLHAVYCVSIFDFAWKPETRNEEKYLHKVKLIDEETGKVFNDKLTFVYIEVPNFNKKPEELETKFEKWVYLLKHLEFLERLPQRIQEKIFSKVMDLAAIEKLEKKDRKAYEESLKVYRDNKNTLDTSFEMGKAEGKAESKVETAINMKKLGIGITVISQATGISIKELERIFKENS